MLADDHPDRIQITFDDRRLVANAGLLLPVTLAQHLGLRELVDHHLDLGNAPGRANPGDKMLTLVASALAGGDCIDDADVLRTGGTAQTLGCVVKAPSTLGTFLRSFRWGHVRRIRHRRGVCWGHLRAANLAKPRTFSHGSAASCWPGPGRLGPDPATRHSPSTWIRRSARHTVWPRRGRATTATRARGAITRCWPWPLAPATC